MFSGYSTYEGADCSVNRIEMDEAEILIDGSNVVFWRAGQLDREVPMMVVRALISRRFSPVIIFDHSIHRHLGEAALNALGALARVNVAPRGTPADKLLLEACDRGRLQIVSGDRFSEWRPAHPQLRREWLVTGRIGKGGRVSFSKKLRPAPV